MLTPGTPKRTRFSSTEDGNPFAAMAATLAEADVAYADQLRAGHLAAERGEDLDSLAADEARNEGQIWANLPESVKQVYREVVA